MAANRFRNAPPDIPVGHGTGRDTSSPRKPRSSTHISATSTGQSIRPDSEMLRLTCGKISHLFVHAQFKTGDSRWPAIRSQTMTAPKEHPDCIAYRDGLAIPAPVLEPEGQANIRLAIGMASSGLPSRTSPFLFQRRPGGGPLPPGGPGGALPPGGPGGCLPSKNPPSKGCLPGGGPPGGGWPPG